MDNEKLKAAAKDFLQSQGIDRHLFGKSAVVEIMVGFIQQIYAKNIKADDLNTNGLPDWIVDLTDYVRPEHRQTVSSAGKDVSDLTLKETIDTVGYCANCGVEFHIHKESTLFDDQYLKITKYPAWKYIEDNLGSDEWKRIIINGSSDDVLELMEKYAKHMLTSPASTEKCKHENITRTDGLDECQDCGVRNY